MTDHTPKLTAVGDKIYGETPEDGIIARVYSDEALAARFVATYNACAGIPTEQLGDVKALVKALEFYSHPDIMIGHIIDGKITGHPDHGDKARAALAPFRETDNV